MIPKIIWSLIGLNTAALLGFIIYFLISTEGRNVDSMESGWTAILFGLGVFVILLAALPLRMSQSVLSLCFSGFFAALPLLIYLFNAAGEKMESMKRPTLMSEVYFEDKKQRSVAAAIENGDIELVKQLIQNQDINIQGTRVWDAEGLNYLEFACRFRPNAADTAVNTAIISLLVDEGSKTTRALAEGINNLPLSILTMFLDAGADPNTHGFVNQDPLVFSALGSTEREVDAAILLVERGAKINVKNREEVPLIMYAVINSDTDHWLEAWRFVRFLIEKTDVDCNANRPGYPNFFQTIESFEKTVAEQNISMPEDFLAVAQWAKNHKTDPKYTSKSE